MSDDWPPEGVRAAAELSTVWTRTFVRCLANGDDHGWAAYEADKARDRLIARVKRQVQLEMQP